MPLTFFLDDDVTPADALVFGSLLAGTSASLTLHLRNTDPSGSSGTTRAQLEVRNPLNQYVADGLPALDGMHFTAQIVGSDRAADPSMADFVGQETPLGSSSQLEVPPISGGCAYYVRLKYAPPLGYGAASETIYFHLAPYLAEIAAPATQALPHLGAGILTGLGDLLTTEWVEPPSVSPSGADVAYGVRYWMDHGLPRGADAQTVTFNGTAADGALAAGQEYQDVISQPAAGGALVETKSNKATAGSSVPPVTPADSLYVETRTVPYGVASTSGVGTLYRGRCVVEVVSGRNLRLCPGRALAGVYLRVSTPISFIVPDNTDTWIWLTSLGNGGVALTSTARAATRGDLLVAEATTSGDVVTVLLDLRTFFEPGAVELRLSYLDEENVSSQRDVRFAEQALAIDRIRPCALLAASGATGQTIFNVNRRRAGASASLFTGDVGRPQIAAGAYTSAPSRALVTELEPGDALSLDIDEITAGGAQASFFEVIVCAAPVR